MEIEPGPTLFDAPLLLWITTPKKSGATSVDLECSRIGKRAEKEIYIRNWRFAFRQTKRQKLKGGRISWKGIKTNERSSWCGYCLTRKIIPNSSGSVYLQSVFCFLVILLIAVLQAALLPPKETIILCVDNNNIEITHPVFITGSPRVEVKNEKWVIWASQFFWGITFTIQKIRELAKIDSIILTKIHP